MPVCPMEESEEAEVHERESSFIGDGDDGDDGDDGKDGDGTSVWSSERDATSPPALLCSPDLDEWSSIGDLLSDTSDDGQDLCPSPGTLSIQEDAPAAESSVEEAQIANCPAADSASSGRRKNLLTRMRRFFRRVAGSLCCCRRPTVDD